MALPDSRLLAQSGPISPLHADALWGKGRRRWLEAPALHSAVPNNISKDSAQPRQAFRRLWDKNDF